MELIVVTSLDALCRQQACEDLAAARPGSLVVLHDLLENGVVVRRTFTGAGEIERGESFLEHGCLSCAVRLDLVPGIERLIQDSRGKRIPGPIIIGLAPATPAHAAVTALNGKLADRATVSSVILALAPDALEDHIWDSHTLFESGFTTMVEDERTPGECLIGELAFADTVLVTEPDIVPPDPAARERGLHLARQLAPHADLASSAGEVRPGRHHYLGSLARTAPGTVPSDKVPSETVHRTDAERPGGAGTSDASPFMTVVQRVERPLHPGRFRQALATLAEGCCVVRGNLWIASAPECRIAIQGVGPRIWLENTGAWDDVPPTEVPAGRGMPAPAATVITATGEDLDAAEFEHLLTSCQLTDEELASGKGLHDPFGLEQAS
ncbi:GTP-binding protein [Pseudarthrobacter scleromae]|uniref:Cobalamin synthesis protein n=1 Tax=Pseudarthrobacter scleromae TaxID=158897 RepID=A0ABQ2CI55_9MICC|nr:GTP-binding protein [Pseudarthrobacter scleromae]GGI88760.1 putative cobalamin synthesis protein [Pseudarthrobacter scleromae]